MDEERMDFERQKKTFKIKTDSRKKMLDIPEEGRDLSEHYRIVPSFRDYDHETLDFVSKAKFADPYEIQEKVGQDWLHRMSFVISENKGITVISASPVVEKELAREVHKLMVDNGFTPQVDLDYISKKDSLETISNLALAMDIHGDVYSKYDLPEGFKTPYELDFRNTVGIEHLPKGLDTVKVKIAPDTLSIEEDSKIETLVLNSDTHLVRLPNVADKIETDLFAIGRVQYIDPDIKMEQIVNTNEYLGKITPEHLEPAQERWTKELKSPIQYPFKAKMMIDTNSY